MCVLVRVVVEVDEDEVEVVVVLSVALLGTQKVRTGLSSKHFSYVCTYWLPNGSRRRQRYSLRLNISSSSTLFPKLVNARYKSLTYEFTKRRDESECDECRVLECK